MTYKSRRYFFPASLPASQETAKRALQARKKAMKLAPLTYFELIEKINYLVTTKQLNAQTAANRCSVLRAFLRSNHLTAEDVVGEEMRGRFTDCIETFLQDVRDAGRSQRNITNTRAALTPLRQMVLEDDTLRALDADKPTPFMQQLKVLTGGLSLRRVASMSHVPYDMFLGWLQGKVPRASSARYVYRVENYFGMEQGELWKLTGSSHPSRMPPQLTSTAPIAYRQALGVNNKLEYCFVALADSPLREQWRHLMVYKTALVPDLERSSKGRWRVSPLPLGRVVDADRKLSHFFG